MTHAPVEYVEGFVADPNAAFKALWTELDWQRRDKVPRREYYANDAGAPYAYGDPRYARQYLPQAWHPVMRELQAKLQAETGHIFEACFLNGYENQSDFLGWHADDSPEMDPKRPIAIISLGAEREIWFRPQDNKEAVERLKLAHGSICIMKPGMQEPGGWYHRIPKASFMCGERISLTFRGYVPPLANAT